MAMNSEMTSDVALSSTLPLVNLPPYLKRGNNHDTTTDNSCQILSDALRDYGAVLIRDPRVSAADADKFLDQMEQYFSLPHSRKMEDVRPEKGYQIGATPPYTENARENREEIERLSDAEKPRGLEKVGGKSGNEKENGDDERGNGGGDPKWRYFWRVCEEGGRLDEDQVVPEGFENWGRIMDEWGSKLMDSLKVVILMLENGLGIKEGALWRKFQGGRHLLAPTGCDLNRYGNKECIGVPIARFHFDLNFLTIHGKSRYPGLYIWTKAGKRLKCTVPVGCLLVQAGVQIEHLTGGVIRRGFHEVVISEDTVKATERAKERNAIRWRVSSTLFGHVNSEESLYPLIGDRKAKKYGDVLAKDQVAAELKAIKLMS